VAATGASGRHLRNVGHGRHVGETRLGLSAMADTSDLSDCRINPTRVAMAYICRAARHVRDPGQPRCKACPAT